MAVALVISETLNGSAVADSLAGGGSGIDLGVVANGGYSPITSKPSNTGRQDLYIRHTGDDPIINVKFFLGEYGLLSGYPYGGKRTAAQDYTKILSLGTASGTSKNNLDGLSGGIWIDHRFNASNTEQFDKLNFPTKVSIFSDTLGADLATAIGLQTDSMCYDLSSVETAATAPVAGSIGKQYGATGITLGDNAHIRMRTYIPLAEIEGGIYQFEFIIAYTYTA
jgi:hypothetical protein